MSRRDRIYTLVLVLALALAVAVELLAPKPLDWTLSFQRDDTRPFGGQVLYELLDDLFPGAPVNAVNLPPYLVLSDTTRTGLYVFVTETFAPDDFETKRLLDFAARGNTVFVAAYAFEGAFADTLKLRTDQALLNVSLDPFDSEDDSIGINLTNPTLRTPADYFLEAALADDAFVGFDTLRTTVLGVNDQEQANYIRLEIGEGACYLSTVPVAFTNYYALYRDQDDYIYRALSYLPVQEVHWDAYHKPNRLAATTPLRFVLQDPALKGAYWTLLVLVALFVVFEARRRQRVIPVIPPRVNTTVEFVETVGRLYFQHADHANLAKKKITYFLDYVRHQLGIPTHTLDARFRTRVAERAGVPADVVEAVFQAIDQVHSQATLSEDNLRLLHRRIEDFYHHRTYGKGEALREPY